MLILIKEIAILILFHYAFSFLQESPYPLELQLTNVTERSYPYFALFKSTPVIFTTGSTYYLITDEDGNFYLQKDDEDFSIWEKFDQFSSDCSIIYKNSYPNYIIPSLKSNLYIREFYTSDEHFDTKMRLNINPYPRTDEQVLSIDTLMVSYITEEEKKGKAFIINEKRSIIVEALTTFTINNQGYFSCKRYLPSYKYYCLYGINNRSIYYIEFNNFTGTFGNARALMDLPSGNSIVTVKAMNYGNNIGLSLAYVSPSNIAMLVKFEVSTTQLTLTKQVSTTLPCTDMLKMNIIYLFEDYFMITTANDSESYCAFFNSNLDKLSIDGKEVCGKKDFRISFLDDIKLHIIYVEDDPQFVYYIEHEIVSCQSKEFLTDLSEPFIISITSLISPIVKYINPDSGFRLTQIDSNPFYGTMIEIDSDGEPVSEVNFSSLYQNIQYTPNSPGENIFEVNIYFEVLSSFYIPVPSCQIVIRNSCYPTCATCSLLGTDENHQCLTCIQNALFEDGTTNCLLSKPDGYYLDQRTRTYKKCILNCKECNDGSSCHECSEGYSLLSQYTLNESDSRCILSCDTSNKKWYIENETNDLICIVGDCPDDYPCYNEKTRQCLIKLTEEYECEFELPRNITLDDLFESIDSNVIQYYAYHMVYSRKNFTTLVYDSFTTSNNSTNQTNLTEIFLGECEKYIREKYGMKETSPLLIAQVEKINTTNGKTEPLFSFYLTNGTKIDLSICFNMTIELNGPSTSEEDLTIEKDEIEDLLDQNIDVFYADDEFFNDICYPFSVTKDNKTADVTLEDRREDYYQNTSLCNKGCSYLGMDMSTLKPKCNCTLAETNTPIGFGEEIVTFFSSLSTANYRVFLCYKLVFSFSNFKYNIGSYCLLVIALMEIVTFCIYLCKRRGIFANIFDDKQQSSTNISTNKALGTNTSNDIFENENEIQIEVNKKESTEHITNEVKSNELSSINARTHPINHKGFFFGSISKYQRGKVNQWVKQSRNNFDPMASPKTNSNPDKMPFSIARKQDKRTFLMLFKARIKQFHPIYKCFIDKSKKNKYHHIISFIFGLATDLAFNAFFYSDAYISNTYRSGYNFFYELPKSIVASLSSTLVRLFVNLLVVDFPDEEELAKAKMNSGNDDKRRIMRKINNSMKSYFILVFILSLLFWYYVTAFCAVYRQSQINWVYGALTSFVISLFIPFILAFINVGLRKISFSCRMEVLYHLARLFEVY